MTKNNNVVELKKPILAWTTRRSPVDGMYRTWTRVDWLRLGFVTQTEVDEAHGAPYINPQQEICILVGKKPPRRADVVEALKRLDKSETQANAA